MAKYVVIFMCISLLAGIPCSADVIYVKAGGTGDGTSWTDAYGDLQDGLGDAIKGDQIWVAEGTYYPTSDYGLDIGDRGKHFRMKNSVAIYGGFPDTGDPNINDRDPDMHKTILSGDLLGNDNPDTSVEDLRDDPNRADNCYHVFYHPAGTNLEPNAILDGFTITGGNSDYLYAGGGMYNWESSPTLKSCNFVGNSATDGGGILNRDDSSPILVNCAFNRNWAEDVGGMFNFRNSDPTLTNCEFVGNSAGRGGGIGNVQSSPRLVNCMFVGNSAAVLSPQWGGGMFNAFSSPTLVNCIFVGNNAGNSGGGIENEIGSRLTLINCTFTGNIAPKGRALASGFDEPDIESGAQIVNCIMWNGGNEIWNIGGGPLTIIYSDIQGGSSGVYDPREGLVWGNGNIDFDPLFVDPNGKDGIIGTEDDNLRLLAGSPCIDAGDNSALPADSNDLDGDGDMTEPIPFDIDDLPRFSDDPNTIDTGNGITPIVDMGAYEFHDVCGDENHPYPTGDMNNDCEVNITDAVILALAWLSEDGGIGWNPDCDISTISDGSIDGLDFAVMGQHWLECTKPECD